MPTFGYYSRCSSVHDSLLHAFDDADWTPTLHYYGVVWLTVSLTDHEADSFDLVPYNDCTASREAEDGALYRAEMRL